MLVKYIIKVFLYLILAVMTLIHWLLKIPMILGNILLYLIYTVYNVIILPFHSCKKKRAPFTALFHIDFLIHLSYSTVLQPMSLNFFPKMGQSLVLHQMPSQLLSFDHILLQIPMQIHNSKHLSE